MSGIAYLVGAGPGAPDLLTLKAAKILKRAEVLVYDYLAAPEILNLAPKNCRRIYVGKMSGNHAKSQEEINGILIEEARAGRVVVRLKGGDPYIFGRGGEEALELHRAGLRFEVVPGISSAAAAAAYAGIPLTHRDFNTEVVIATGHERPDKAESARDWRALAKMGVISMVMGVKNLGSICASLIAAGRSPGDPAALIQWGTTPRQRSVTAPLSELAKAAEAAKIQAPALFVCGRVVKLSPELNWFERLPLFGRRILVARSREQISRLSELLRDLGAEVWEKPTIAINPILDAETLEKILAESFHWLVFTSPNGARLFLEKLFESGRDARAVAGAKIAAVGPATAEALAPFGLRADLVPEKYVAESLLAALKRENLAGRKILLARAEEGRDLLPEGLRAAGVEVRELAVYRTVNPVWDEPLPARPISSPSPALPRPKASPP